MWVKFWKRSGANWTLDETYKYYPNESPKDCRDDDTFKYDAEAWAESTPGGSERGFEYGWEKVQHPPVEWLKKHKDYIVDEINDLHKKHGVYQATLNMICRKKGHKIKKTKFDYVICDVCQEDLGWYCPDNPKQYCEYDDEHGENCIHCGAPEERK